METELSKARGHAKSAITKRVKEIIHLMRDKENEELVHRKVQELKEAFSSFQVAHEAYHFEIDPSQREESMAYYELVEEQVNQIQENVQLWSTGLEAASSVHKLDVRPEDSVSQAGSNKSRKSQSSRLSAISDGRIRASATKSILEAEGKALKKLHEIEAEELRLRQRKAELDFEIEYAKAKAEEKAFQEEAMNEEKFKGKINYSPPASPLPQDKKPPQLSYPPPQQQPIDQSFQLQSLLQHQQDTIRALTLPQPQMQVFSGNPIEYQDFVRAFQNLIETKTRSSSARLYYLIQYTDGQVRDLVRSCLAMPEETGYKKARQLLAERYGKPFNIATAYVNRVTDGPPIPKEDGEALQSFSILLTSCSNTLREIGYLNRLENPEGLRKIMERLPYNLRLKWREKADSIMQRESRDPNLQDLNEFVETSARVVNNPIFGKVADPPKPKSSPPSRQPRKEKSTFFTESPVQEPKQKDPIKCPSCAKNHWLSQCNDFKKLKVPDRYKLVREKRLCFNCLTSGHLVHDCPKKSFCRVEGCEKKHSTFLHEINKEENTRKQEEQKDEKSKEQPNQARNPPASNGFVSQAFKSSSVPATVIGLPIVPVRVRAKNRHQTVETYALLDTGSNTSFCTESLLEKLNEKGTKTTLTLTTLHGRNKSTECDIVNLEVLGLDNASCINLPSVYSRPSLPVSTQAIGKQQDAEKWPYLQGINIKSIDSEIGLLIGNDCPTALQPKEIKASQDGGPYATRTVFGWVLNGPLGRDETSISVANFIERSKGEDLDEQFRSYCNLEFNDSSYGSNLSLSQNDKRALKIMEDTIELKNGHYEIALPWKNNPPALVNNRELAENRLRMLKRRLQSNPELHAKYKEFMEDLLEKNHARKVPEEELETKEGCYYLAHHPILPTTAKPKVRIVYDCQAKYKGTSLNDQLLQGPDLTNSLVGVLTRFRKEPVAFMSDIKAMFYQVRVKPKDYNYLRFLWWPEGNLDTNPEEYQMLVHLFGSVSSPSCANFALKRTAEDNREMYDPSVIEAVNKSFYVDDCLHSTATENEAVEVATDLRELLSKGGFRLTKWVSNSRKLLESLPETERAASVKDLDFDTTKLTERALGIQWNVHEDTFGFKIAPKEKPSTRRGLLSVISSVYDPLGFVSPSILPAKALLQDLCRRGLGWDEEIPEADQVRWRAWLKDLPKLEKFSIPRCFKLPDQADTVKYELHHFSDASSTGYGAVSYLRQIEANGAAHCALVTAKSRLAPLKTMTIPRMELSAAVLATRLDRMIREEIGLPLAQSTFWTDSTCVIRYIENKDKRFQVFVANRVATILDQSSPNQWRYVDTAQNPADEASRGMSVDELLANDRWTKGPAFLRQSEDTWPTKPASINILPQDDPEVKKESAAYVSDSSGDASNSVNKIFEKFSSWTRLRRVIAWVLRYKDNLRKHAAKRKSGATTHFDKDFDSIEPLRVTEIQEAEREIIKHVQARSFQKEISMLKVNPKVEKESLTVQKSSDIFKLDPILRNGLLLVGGRLDRASIDDNAKHPIIVPKKHHVVSLIIKYYHMLAGHSGVEHTLSLMRQKFWIIGARVSVRNIVNSCFDCKRRQAPVMQQKMANLPEDRVTASKPPFAFVGVDCFGPFEVRRGRVSVKRYGVLFTCLNLRAVHVELASSLDTDSFINALRRFMARRGQPEEIRSDNGGNFVRGEKELRQAIENWNQSRIHDYLSQREIKWIFNPPAGSHHGGVWERCIRTVRKVLRAVVKEQRLDDEGLNTLMCEVESIVNGRPITRISDDPRDAEPLTPNHLLLLRAGPTAPPGIFDKQDSYGRKRWRQVQYLADVFWKRWIREYLPSLQQRHKWNKQRANVSVNDIVLVTDDNTPRSCWPLAKVLEAYTSNNDGLVRSVKLKTSTTVLVRPVDKIVLLESTAAESDK